MRKTALTYILIVNLFCLIICIANLFIKIPTTEEVILIVTSLICLICYLFIKSKENTKAAYLTLLVIYFTQSFSILLSNFTWKFISGTDLTLYFINLNDFSIKLDFKVFNIYALCNTISNEDNWAIGFNIIHFFVFYGLLKSYESYNIERNVA